MPTFPRQAEMSLPWKNKIQGPACSPFWFMPVSVFGMIYVTRIIVSSREFTLLPEPSPLPRDTRSCASASRHRLHPKVGSGVHCQDGFRHDRYQSCLHP